MPEAKFLLVTFNFEGRIAPNEKLKTLFDKALDWVNYAPNCYILYTTTSHLAWKARIRKALDDDSTVFIVEFDPDKKTGFAPKRVWDWFKKDRSITSA